MWAGLSDSLLTNRLWQGKNAYFIMEKTSRQFLNQMINSNVDIMWSELSLQIGNLFSYTGLHSWKSSSLISVLYFWHIEILNNFVFEVKSDGQRNMCVSRGDARNIYVHCSLPPCLHRVFGCPMSTRFRGPMMYASSARRKASTR